MKKIIISLFAILVLGMASCDRTPKGTANLKDTDLVVFDHGQMKLYQSSTNTLTDFKAETDSVINAVFGLDNKLYYTVAKSNNLTLKCLDLNAENPEPRICAGWNLKLKQIQDYFTGAVSELFLIHEGKQVAILCGLDDEENYGFVNASVYDIATGKVKLMGEEDFFSTEFYVNKIDNGSFDMDDGQFYFYTYPGEHCLTDKLDFTEYFGEEEWERDELECEPLSMSPMGNWLLFNAVMPWGDYGLGPYCVATLDGSKQQILKGTYITDTEPGWLKNGSLVYLETVGEEYDPSQVKIMDNNGNITTLCKGTDIAVRLLNLDELIEQEAKKAQGPTGAANSELAFFDKGKLSFYSSIDKVFYSVDKETDSVVTGTFSNDGKFYYCVDKGGNVFLKYVDLNNQNLEPVMLFDWGLETQRCVTETYGDFSPLYCFNSKKLLMLYYDFSWDYFDFENARLYNLRTGKVKEYDWEEDNEIWDELFYEELDDSFYGFKSEDGEFYYDNNGEYICLSDQLDPEALVSDPDFGIELVYYESGVSPKSEMVLFCAPIEAGDFEHGPYCVASLDGKFQMMFPETDFCQNEAVWLSDGSLVIQSSEENTGCIKILHPDRTIDILSYATKFVKRE